jgi:hypothetical protein
VISGNNPQLIQRVMKEQRSDYWIDCTHLYDKKAAASKDHSKTP